MDADVKALITLCVIVVASAMLVGCSTILLHKVTDLICRTAALND
jgi:hypothetical protein